MTDRELLLAALVREAEQGPAAGVSVMDVIRMLEQLGAEYRQARIQTVPAAA